jgi:hypothetical protein
MVRRTVNFPESVDMLVREAAEEGESFSATVARLVEAGARAGRPARPPRYVSAGGSGPEDLGVRAERYLRDLVEAS